ncbi:hypothetical protein IAD21_00793 [Abditibacteriota bacterium]|nr:hypothetical protein IAD21_00793 [Abditibacteriota bacterium]
MRPNKTMKSFVFRCSVLASPVLALIATQGCAQNQMASAQAAIKFGPGTLLSYDFESRSWPVATIGAVGTIDIAGSTQLSRGVASSGIISSGPLAIANSETNLGKLTLAFSLSASAARPVVVRVESFDKKQKRTGGLETTIYPAAPDFYQRYALDLNTFKATGQGKFQPGAPFISFSFQPDKTSWKGVEKPEIRLDNVHYAKPAWYVSAQGSDKNDGRTEKTAFATPQKAVDIAGPGDIISVMDGTYLPGGVQAGIVHFEKTGTPAGWISLKNYPGHHPLFSLVGSWGAIRMQRTAEQAAEQAANGTVVVAPSYIEVRGMHIRGEGDIAKTKYPDLMGQSAPETNGNGIAVGWKAGPKESIPHHLRFADNVVEYCPGAGIGPGQADWVTIENNVVRNNCWTAIYGTSGISLNHGANFDGTKNKYTILIRGNVTSGNRCFVPWKQVGKISDGNGIIVDINQDSSLPEEERHQGRTLIQNNLSFNNGGSGIHTLSSKRVDIINNTAYMNGASPELRWGQIFLQHTDDATIINNILWTREGQPVNTVSLNSNDTQNTHVLRANNLYFGGVGPIMGENDHVGDPNFVNPSVDEKVADFHLKPGSPAIGAGRTVPVVPFLDLDGKPRGAAPSKGVYQQ